MRIWAVALLAALPLPAARTNKNETPRARTAVLFQPCEHELGSLSGPLKALAENQNYTYTEYTNTTPPHPGGAAAATLDVFATLGGVGLLQLATHGGPDRILVECYRRVVNDKGEPQAGDEKALRDARLKRICDGTDKPGGVQLKCPDDVGRFSGSLQVQRPNLNVELDATDWGIGLTKKGIEKLFKPKDHQILFAGACSSFETRSAFTTAAIEYFGYTQACVGGNISKDTEKLYKRLSGNEFDGKAREVGTGNMFNVPDQTCTAWGKDAYSRILRKVGPGNTTVAPIVAWVVPNNCQGGDQLFRPRNQSYAIVGEERIIEGSVTFDTIMDTSVPPGEIIAVDGCRAELRQVRWADDKQTITFSIAIREAGTLEIRAKQSRALSLHNKNNLDGNQNPNPFKDNGVGPNRDDYVARNTCTKSITPGGGEETPGQPPDGGGGGGGHRLMEEVLQTAPLTLRAAEPAVGEPGSAATAVVELINSGSTDIALLSLSATNLVSGPNAIPASAISFDPSPVSATARSSYTIGATIQIPSNQASGLYSGAVTARNPDNVQAQTNIAVVVNRPPVLTVPGPLTVAAGDTLSLDLVATDPEGDPVRFTTFLPPDGSLLVDRGNGRATFRFQPALDQAGLEASILLVAYNPLNVQGPPPQDPRQVLVRVTAPPPLVTSVSSASYTGPALAPESIAAAFGQRLATSTQTATTTPLPTTLAGSGLRLTDSAGVERAAQLFFASPGQINYLVPPGIASGVAVVRVVAADNTLSLGTVQIQTVAPGLYTADATGRGRAAGFAVRAGADGAQFTEPLTTAIDVGSESDRVVLVLFGTGLRGRSALSAVSATLGGTALEVLYAGPQGTFVGLDQLNLALPRSLAGRGELNLALTIDGRAANPVTVAFR
jgi:uncharacterized protein (TIGR03437 family)